jgi:H+/Cl- antiporter ClcA
VLGILCALFGDIFKRSLYLAQDLFDKSRLPHLVRPVFPLLLSVPLSFFLYNVTGGGHELIDMLSGKSFAIHYLLLLLVVKLLFTAFCTGSGTSGGIFLPLLSCGALLGDVFGKILTAAGYITTEQQLNFMILGMAATFSSVIKAPVTGIVLVLEMTANFNHLGSLVLVSLSSFVTAELISSRAVYDVMLNRLLRKERHV